MAFAPITEILEDLRAAKMVVLVDDALRENEGDLVCAAQFTTPQVVNFMTRHARGVLCVAMDSDRCDALELTPQSRLNTASLGTAFTVTVDAHSRFGVTTGVSASDRSVTIKLLADDSTKPTDLARPGHINPLRARDGGVLVRTGQTEGSVDLCKLAGLRPAASIIEVMNDDGSMARLPDLERLCRTHELKMCKVADIIAHRLAGERLVHRVAESEVRTAYGDFRLIAYRSRVDPLPHVALVAGRVGRQEVSEPVLVRVQPHDLLGDVFGEVTHPSGETLRQAMQAVAQAGEGAIVYMRQDAMGAGLLKQLQTVELGGEGARPRPPRRDRQAEQALDIGIGSQILRDLGVRQMRLMTNHPEHHYVALEGFGLHVAEVVGIKE